MIARSELTGGIGDDLALRIQQSSSSRSSPAVYKIASSALMISFKVLVGVPLRELHLLTRRSRCNRIVRTSS